MTEDLRRVPDAEECRVSPFLLEDQHREIIQRRQSVSRLWYAEHCGVPEIAERLGVSQSTIRNDCFMLGLTSADLHGRYNEHRGRLPNGASPFCLGCGEELRSPFARQEFHGPACGLLYRRRTNAWRRLRQGRTPSTPEQLQLARRRFLGWWWASLADANREMGMAFRQRRRA